MRAFVVALASAIAGWAGLWVLLGNAGLQHAVTGGAERLLEHLPSLLGAAMLSVATAYVLGTRLRRVAGGPTHIAIASAALNLVAGAAAVAVVGELGLEDLPRATAVVSGLGTQVAAAAVGFELSHRMRRTARS